MKLNLSGQHDPNLKTYRFHYCSTKHRSYFTIAKCLWPRAEWISGDGPYASLARCRVLTIQMYQDYESALQAKSIIDNSGCGGACPCTGRGHEIIFLLSPKEMGQRW